MGFFKNRLKKVNNTGFYEENSVFRCDNLAISSIEDKEDANIITSKTEFLSRADITKKDFKNIITACFKVSNGFNKLLITLNIPIDDVKVYVRSFIRLLKLALPKEVCDKLNLICENGKLTIYSKDNTKKLKKIEETYIFDFEKEKFELLDASDTSSYVDYVFDNLELMQKIEDLKSIADSTVEDKFNEIAYNDIVDMFILYDDREKLSLDERIGLLKAIYENIVNSNGAAKKQESYVRLFSDIFIEEFKSKRMCRQEYIPEEDTIDMILNFYNYIDKYFEENASENCKKSINAYLLITISDGKAAEKFEYVKNILFKANENPVVFRKFIDMLFVNESFVEEILKWYIQDEFQDTKEVKDILQYVTFWGKTSPSVVAMDFFVECIENKIIELVEGTEDKVRKYTIIYEYLKNFHSLCPLKEDINKYLDFQDKIRNKIYSYMMEAMDLNNIQYRDILSIELEKCDEDNIKEKYVYNVQALLNNDKNLQVRAIERFICTLSKEEMFNAENLVREYYSNKVSEENFRRIMVGFVEQAVYVNDSVLYNVDELLQYIYESGGVNEARKFILWVSDSFIDLNEAMLIGRFKSGFSAYFYQLDVDAFKDSTFNKMISQMENKEMKKSFAKYKKGASKWH